MADNYQVRTPNGYVGRYSLDTDLVDNCPVGMSYAWPRDEAAHIAVRFGGEIEPRRLPSDR